MFFFSSGCNPAWKAIGGDSLLSEKARHLLGPSPGRAVHDGTARGLGRQVLVQDHGDVVELLRVARLNYDEFEVRALAAAVEHPHLEAELLPEVIDDLFLDTGLGRRRQTQHRRNYSVFRPLADEATHVAIVGAEVMSPLRQAVGLVQHPGADLALLQGATKRHAAELLGRDQHDGGIPEPEPLQSVGPLGHRQHAVDRDAGDDAVCLESCDLVGHQGHQWRDDHGDRPGLVVS